MIGTIFSYIGDFAYWHTPSFIALCFFSYLCGIGLMYGFDEALRLFRYDRDLHVLVAIFWPFRLIYLIGKFSALLFWWFAVRGFMTSMISVGYQAGLTVEAQAQKISKVANNANSRLEYYDKDRGRYVTAYGSKRSR